MGYLEQLRALLLSRIDRNTVALFLFGSRASGGASARSDVDIGIWGPRPLAIEEILAMRAAIEASDIPYAVDLVDFATVDDAFKKVATEKVILWNAPKNFHIS